MTTRIQIDEKEVSREDLERLKKSMARFPNPMAN